MNKKEALETMKEVARDTIYPSTAASLISPWTTLKKLGVQPRRLKDFPRLVYHPNNANCWAYSTDEIVEALALSLGVKKYYSPIEGAGSRRQDIVDKYVSKIATPAKK